MSLSINLSCFFSLLDSSIWGLQEVFDMCIKDLMNASNGWIQLQEVFVTDLHYIFSIHLHIGLFHRALLQKRPILLRSLLIFSIHLKPSRGLFVTDLHYIVFRTHRSESKSSVFFHTYKSFVTYDICRSLCSHIRVFCCTCWSLCACMYPASERCTRKSEATKKSPFPISFHISIVLRPKSLFVHRFLFAYIGLFCNVCVLAQRGGFSGGR